MRRAAISVGVLVVASAACGDSVLFGGGSTSGAGGDAGSGAGAGGAGSTTSSTTSTAVAGGGPTGGSGGVGGIETGCQSPDDCAVDSPCVIGICQDDGTCATTPTKAGEPCGDGHVCDGQGECLASQGVACGADEECLSGHCADGLCCDSACAGVCEACDVSGLEGVCSAHAAGTDPDAECSGGLCDGKLACAGGGYLAGGSYGSSNSQIARAVAVDAAGEAVVTGYFWDTIDFGKGAMTSAGAFDVFVLKLTAAGAPLWSKRFGDPSYQRAWDVAVGPKGEIAVIGYFSGALDFGGGPLYSGGNDDIFVAVLDPNGGHMWSKAFGGNGLQQARSVSIDSQGNVAVAGYYQGAVDFGGGPLYSSGNNYDGFVAVFDATGAHQWSMRIGDGQDQRVYGVDHDAADNLVIAGRHFGGVDLGGGTLYSAGDRDIFVAKLDAKGSHLWSKQFGDQNLQLAWNVAVSPQSGSVALLGYARGAVDFGGGALVTQGNDDAYVAVLDTNGKHLWSKVFGGGASQELYDAAFDSHDNVVVAGVTSESIDFGGGMLQGGGGEDAATAKFAAGGEHLWSKLFAANGSEVAHGVATGKGDEVWLVGYHSGTIDLGGGSLGANGYDAFIGKFAP